MPAPMGHPPYNVNGEGGRPLKYTTEVIEKYADEFEKWLENENNIWIKDFAIEKKFNTALFGIWANSNERFSNVLELAKLKQESRLLKGGLTNKFNPGLVKFTLNVHHGWVEKKETVHSNDPNNPVPEWIIKAAGTSKDLIHNDSD